MSPRHCRNGLLSLLAMAGATAGCERSQPAPPPPRATEVLVSPAVVREVTDHEDFTGRTDAINSIDVRARVTGYLDKVLFKDGIDVKKNDLLCEIDPRPYKAALDQAVAQVRLNEAQARLADAEYARTVRLQPTGAASQEDVDKARAARDTASAQVRASQADVESKQLNLDFTKVTAPVDGRISRRMIDPGNLAKADDTILTNIVTQDQIYAYFDVDERTMLRIRRLIRAGKVRSAREARITVKLGLSDETDFPHEGVIDFADNKVDPSTGTLKVRAVFPNENRILSPGLFARVRLPVGNPHPATLVPERSLGTDQGQKYLYVVKASKDGKTTAEYRRVKLGFLDGQMRVIEDGIKEGEKVVVSGMQRLKDGAEVEPKDASPDLLTAGPDRGHPPLTVKPGEAATPPAPGNAPSGGKSGGDR